MVLFFLLLCDCWQRKGNKTNTVQKLSKHLAMSSFVGYISCQKTKTKPGKGGIQMSTLLISGDMVLFVLFYFILCTPYFGD
jgi:hypothetical protein